MDDSTYMHIQAEPIGLSLAKGGGGGGEEGNKIMKYEVGGDLLKGSWRKE